MKKLVIGSFVLLAVLFAALTAEAHGPAVTIGFGFGFPGVIYPAYGYYGPFVYRGHYSPFGFYDPFYYNVYAYRPVYYGPRYPGPAIRYYTPARRVYRGYVPRRYVRVKH
jgi:hypothetical protein